MKTMYDLDKECDRIDAYIEKQVFKNKCKFYEDNCKNCDSCSFSCECLIKND